MIRIELLEHRQPDMACQIHAVLMLAYAQEAALLHAGQFPPLERTAGDVQADRGRYFGALKHELLVGALSYEPDEEPGQTLISSLVVHPAYQRQGIATALVAALIHRSASNEVLAVSTGAMNLPALGLYEDLGFRPYRFGTFGPQALPLVKLRRASISLNSP